MMGAARRAASSRAARAALLFVVVLASMGASPESGGSTGQSIDIVGILREFGFPVFVSLWFMWRVEKRLDGFTSAIQNLLTTVTIVAKTVDGWHPGSSSHGTNAKPARAGTHPLEPSEPSG